VVVVQKESCLSGGTRHSRGPVSLWLRALPLGRVMRVIRVTAVRVGDRGLPDPAFPHERKPTQLRQFSPPRLAQRG
jgi:hypothetical protein